MSIPLSLSGKVALISGGSRGIGAATVRMFAAADAKVAFSYRSARSQAEALAKVCGSNVSPIASDLNNPEAARTLVAPWGASANPKKLPPRCSSCVLNTPVSSRGKSST